MNSEIPAIEIEGLNFAYAQKQILYDLHVSFAESDLAAIIGPNGAGKTTLLSCVNGLIRPSSGRIRLHRTDIGNLDAKQRARLVAAVPQEFHIPFAYRVREIVALGRSPHLDFWGSLTEVDEHAVDEALLETETSEFQSRRFNELSGGERQRVIVAMALAQSPRVLLLDEPTTHLDLAHQIDILNLVRRVNREQQVTVVACMHDINLAAAFFNRLLVIHDGHLVADGPPAEVLTQKLMADVFKIQADVAIDPSTGCPRLALQVQPNGKE
jgi:iron complex transport system ATP-binding protein